MTILCRWCRKNRIEVTIWRWLMYWTIITIPMYGIVPCEDCYEDVARALPPGE